MNLRPIAYEATALPTELFRLGAHYIPRLSTSPRSRLFIFFLRSRLFTFCLAQGCSLAVSLRAVYIFLRSGLFPSLRAVHFLSRSRLFTFCLAQGCLCSPRSRLFTFCLAQGCSLSASLKAVHFLSRSGLFTFCLAQGRSLSVSLRAASRSGLFTLSRSGLLSPRGCLLAWLF